MKKYAFIGVWMLLLSAVTAQAETMYVDLVKITMRREPGNDRKILAMISPGQRLEVLERGEGWTKALLPNGKEGWVLTRYLTSKKPAGLAKKKSEEGSEALSEQISDLTEENKKLKEEVKRLTSGFTSEDESFDRLRKSYESLKTECADFLKLKLEYKKTASHLLEQTKKSEKMQQELTELKKDRSLKWFIYGAGVLFVGVIIGVIMKGRPRRSSLM
ncbi:TIGR04211 family SH3 domain-containing protein [Desulfococcaceae bacterium HSG8]|nr:TIGR04211 family SH3 domain-containing protein [Desulfococcaceae bacterium HSG8]